MDAPDIWPSASSLQLATDTVLVQCMLYVSVLLFRRSLRRNRPFVATQAYTAPIQQNKRQRRNAARRAARLAALTAGVAAELDGQHFVENSTRPRHQYPREDPQASSWWKYCADDADKASFNDPQHRDGKLFRRRFRVPWSVFQEIWHEARDNDWFPQHMPGLTIWSTILTWQ